MPLVLRLRPGDDFFVAKERVIVGKLLGGPTFELEVPRTGRKYVITDQESTEMREVPDVFLGSGGRCQKGLARVTIDAPREVSILRGENFRHDKLSGPALPPPGEAKAQRVNPGKRWA